MLIIVHQVLTSEHDNLMFLYLKKSHDNLVINEKLVLI